jgi:hypothetical protein
MKICEEAVEVALGMIFCAAQKIPLTRVPGALY